MLGLGSRGWAGLEAGTQLMPMFLQSPAPSDSAVVGALASVLSCALRCLSSFRALGGLEAGTQLGPMFRGTRCLSSFPTALDYRGSSYPTPGPFGCLTGLVVKYICLFDRLCFRRFEAKPRILHFLCLAWKDLPKSPLPEVVLFSRRGGDNEATEATLRQTPSATERATSTHA